MKRRNFLKGIVAGSTAAPLLSWSDIFANIKRLTKQRIKQALPPVYDGIYISANGHRFGQVFKISGSSHTVEIDVTSLDSTVGFYGLPDEGTVTMVYAPVDAYESELIYDAHLNQESLDMEISLSDGTIFNFSAYVLSHAVDIAVDDLVKVTADLRIVGAVTKT